MRPWTGIAMIAMLIATPAALPSELAGDGAATMPSLGTAAAAAQADVAARRLAAPAPAPQPVLLRHGQAVRRLERAGIRWRSTGGCSRRSKPWCTSFERIRRRTIQGLIRLKRKSGCKIVASGGTETGHARGRYSHGRGYKIDIHPNKCINSYITSTYGYVGTRGDGAALYTAGVRSSDIYAREPDHWDITYR